jgi:hypothetical protein
VNPRKLFNPRVKRVTIRGAGDNSEDAYPGEANTLSYTVSLKRIAKK